MSTEAEILPPFNTLAQQGKPSLIIIIDYLIQLDSWEILGESKLNWIFAAMLVKGAPLRLISGMMAAQKMRPRSSVAKGISGIVRRCSSCVLMYVKGSFGAKHSLLTQRISHRGDVL